MTFETHGYFVNQYCQNSWLGTEICTKIANYRATIATVNLLLLLKIDMYHYHLLAFLLFYYGLTEIRPEVETPNVSAPALSSPALEVT